MGAEQVRVTRRSAIGWTGAALAMPAALFQPNVLETRRMSFTPKFVDLVRNFTTTVGTGDFLLGPAVNGFASFAAALQAGDQFYYSAIGIDHPTEREVGRGTLQANGTVSRSPIVGTPTNFSTGTKTIALIAAAEWFNQMQSGGGGASQAATKAALAAAATQAPVMLTQQGAEGLFAFDGSNLSAEVAADAQQGIHVAPQSDPTGASGAWVRTERDQVNAFWFMSPAQVEDVRAFTYAQNVTDALRAASSYVERSGGGTLLLPKGGYLVGKQTFRGTLLDGVTPCAYGPEEIVTIRNCANPLKISGYGAVLKAADGLRYGSFDRMTGNRFDPPSMPFLDYNSYAYPYRAMLNLESNAAVVIEGLELDGNNTRLVLGGYFGDSQRQVEGHGIWAQSNASLVIRDCHVHHQPCDGLALRGGAATEGSAPLPMTVRNLKSRFNGRLGVSLTGGKSVIFENCDLSQTGRAQNAGSSELVQSAPGAGIDIEPEVGIVRDVQFTGCTFVGNWLGGVKVTSGDSRGVSFRRCKIDDLICTRPDYTFDECTILGCFDVGLTAVDEYTGLARSEKDSQVFRKCRFTYDATLTEDGALSDASQARLDTFLWGRMENCSIETGAVNLPSMNLPDLSEATPVVSNCRFSSTSAAPVNLFARYQGYNYINHGGTPTFSFGAKSRIETGDVIVNGVGQASGPHLGDGDYGDVKVSAGGTAMTVESVTLAGTNFPINAPAASDCNVVTNAAAGQQKAFQFTSGGLLRWQFASDNTPEFGGNNGSNFSIVRFDDLGLIEHVIKCRCCSSLTCGDPIHCGFSATGPAIPLLARQPALS